MEDKKIIVAIGGLIGSGKNTAADRFIGNGFEPYIFAEPMKKFFAFSFGISREEAENKSLEIPELPGWTLRKLYQFFGTELIRNQIHQDYWVISMKRRLYANNYPLKVVIPDFRFPNERDKLKELLPEYNIYTVNIYRPDIDVDKNYLGFESHTSETESSKISYDYCIENDCDIETLNRKIDALALDITFKNIE